MAKDRQWQFETLSPDAQKALDSLFSKYDHDDPFSSHCVIGLFDVLRAHYLICDFFSEKGEGLFQAGPRDLSLLESAVSRQQSVHFNSVKWHNEIEKIASLFFGLIKDHPFHDANKRTAFLIMLYALHVEKYTPKISEKEIEDFTVNIASNNYKTKARFKSLKDRYGESDAAVYFIAEYLSDNFRKVDKRRYLVNYRELNQILKRFGYELSNPDKNYIDVVRRVPRRKWLGWGPREVVDQKVKQIGFPGWTREVNKDVVDEVRVATGLTYRDGFDSAAFFQAADPAAALISRYQTALERLAYR
ncbi:type II toxin-antitoxin system death-on-curing family toxin [Brevundimonas poindexterae]|uniref:type II toxin-antitoxin system death-on-curing family toxin n=1 Tax=Brevundimonas poindexterae TaxID=74325 RepID=UPI001CFD9083|nr:Fic family protein [Brevundimonas poindexterae]